MKLFRRRKRPPYEPIYQDEEGWVVPHMGIVITDMDMDLRFVETGEAAEVSPSEREELKRRIAEGANREAWERLGS